MTISVTQAVMAAEMPAITAWAARNGWAADYDGAALKGCAVVQHPNVDGQVVKFWFDVEGYPNVQPPAWWCGGDGTAISTNKADYPRAPQNPPYPAITSIFHANPVICAPWNRLACAVHGGPHTVADWPNLAGWKTTAPEHTQAHTVADMLSSLDLHLHFSDGMQA